MVTEDPITVVEKKKKRKALEGKEQAKPLRRKEDYLEEEWMRRTICNGYPEREEKKKNIRETQFTGRSLVC